MPLVHPIGTCPECGTGTYLTAKGLIRKHKSKAGGLRQYERPICTGSGLAPSKVVS